MLLSDLSDDEVVNALGGGWVSPDEAAEVLGHPKSTLSSWRRRGSGPPYRKMGTLLVRYPLAELLEWRRGSPVRKGIPVASRQKVSE